MKYEIGQVFFSTAFGDYVCINRVMIPRSECAIVYELTHIDSGDYFDLSQSNLDFYVTRGFFRPGARVEQLLFGDAE